MELIGGIDFEELRSQRVKNYDTITLALDAAAVDKEYIVTGNYFYIVEATDIDVEINVRINEQSRKQIRLVHGRAVRTPFYRLYLSWTAQAGKSVTIAIGVGQEDLFEISDVGKALELSGNVEINKSMAKDADHFSFKESLDSQVGSLPVISLWNPVGSGVNAFVYRWGVYRLDPYLETQAMMCFIDATTLLGVHGGLTVNKRAGAGNPVCLIYDGWLTALQFFDIRQPDFNFVSLSIASGALSDKALKFRTPYMIPPGYGLAGSCAMGVAYRCALQFSWYEEPV